MIIFISMFSFILDGLLMRYLGYNTIFLPLLTLVSLILIYPYFNDNNYRYFKYIAILGLLYDIVYMNTLFFNFFIFMILGFVIVLLNYLLSNNLFINVLITIITIILYRVINYLFYFFIGSIEFSFKVLLNNILCSLILNIIYCIIIYVISEYYSKKNKIFRSK